MARGELRDLTDDVDVVNWFSALPGFLGILGWLLRHTVLSRWSVTARPITPSTEAPVRLDRLKRAQAEETFTWLVAWLESEHPLRVMAL
ncbi:MAG: hypothetical protein J2P22_04650 [Nocardioides sp.]|nr:hypothetical protein [Nocardioides sp.]